MLIEGRVAEFFTIQGLGEACIGKGGGGGGGGFSLKIYIKFGCHNVIYLCFFFFSCHGFFKNVININIIFKFNYLIIILKIKFLETSLLISFSCKKY
jgi:hypothetical protein